MDDQETQSETELMVLSSFEVGKALADYARRKSGLKEAHYRFDARLRVQDGVVTALVSLTETIVVCK